MTLFFLDFLLKFISGRAEKAAVKEAKLAARFEEAAKTARERAEHASLIARAVDELI